MRAVDAVLITGGTGFSGRDSTPEAVRPLFDKDIDGFGEVFRALSYQEIGSSTIQSRAVAGFANNTVIFCMPGSTGACKTAWNGLIREQLDSSHRPCNFVGVLRSGAGGLTPLLPLEEALARVLAGAPTAVDGSQLPCWSPGRVSGAGCMSAIAVPGDDNSAMDGYALRAAEAAQATAGEPAHPGR